MRETPVPFIACYAMMEDKQLWELLDVVHRSNAAALVCRYQPDGSRALLAGIAPWWVILAGLTALAAQPHPTGDLLRALEIYASQSMSGEEFAGMVVPYPGADSTEQGPN